MGVTQSKSTDQKPVVNSKAYALTPQFIAPDGIVDKMKGLGEVITYFNDNDTSSIETFIDTYNQKVTSAEKIELGPEVKGMMMSFHNQLLEVIDTQLVGASPSEKQQVLKSKLKDNKQLNEMLRLYYNQKMQDVEERVLGDEVVKGNKDISDTVKTIMNNVKSLKVKYKFFEYKYIQLNVFMIVFIQYVYNSMSKFIVDVIAYNQTRDAIRQEMTQKIFQATQEIMGASDIQLKPEDADAINKMIGNLQDKVKKDQQEITQLSGQLKNNSLSDLLNFVLSSDESLASHIMEGVDKYKETKGVVQRPQTQMFTPKAQVQQSVQPFAPKPQAQQPQVQPFAPKVQAQQQPQPQPFAPKVQAQQQPQPFAPKAQQQPAPQQQPKVTPPQPQPKSITPSLEQLIEQAQQPFQYNQLPVVQQVTPPVPIYRPKQASNATNLNANKQKQNARARTNANVGAKTNTNSQNFGNSSSKNKNSSSQPAQQGGFLRDSSILPQAFFQLNK